MDAPRYTVGDSIAALMEVTPPSLRPSVARLSPAPANGRGRRWQGGALVEEATSLFASACGPADKRALASLWSMYVFGALLLPAATMLIRLGHAPSMPLDEIGFDLARDGTIDRVWIPPSRTRWTGFEPLLREQLLPFTLATSARTGLSPRVLWANAATILHYGVGELADGHDRSDRAREVRAILAGDTQGLGASLGRPFHEDPARALQRRICCLRYRIPNVVACDVCPLATQVAARR